MFLFSQRPHTCSVHPHELLMWLNKLQCSLHQSQFLLRAASSYVPRTAAVWAGVEQPQVGSRLGGGQIQAPSSGVGRQRVWHDHIALRAKTRAVEPARGCSTLVQISAV